jgi:CBS domain-containing protein
MKVTDVMSTDVVAVRATTPLREVARLLVERLMYGIEGQLKLEARTAGDAMTAPPRTIAPWRTVSSAAAQMLEQHVNRLPVVEHGRLVGIVTRADLVRAFARTDAEIEHEIRDLMKRMLLPETAAVRVEVDEGDVTLTGRLERRTDVDILTRLTERVPGVVSVASDLTWRGNEWKRR